MKNFKIYKISSFFILFLFLVPLIILGAEWKEPTCDPPGCNVTAPLNQGSTPQFKIGGLHIGDAPFRGYQFSVQNGQSYFSQDLEVGDFLDITASNGNIETEGNITLQQGANILFNSSSNQLLLKADTINMNTDASSAILIESDNGDPDSVVITAGISHGTAIYGETEEGIGIHGKAIGSEGIGVVGEAGDAATIAGRFDGEVRFNPNSGSDYTEIDGSHIASYMGSRIVEINPASMPGGIDIGGSAEIGEGASIAGDLTLSTGDLDVITGLIDMHNDKIINLEYPTDDTDATNKQYVDDQIGGSIFWDASRNNIYNKNDGNVGIGTDSPTSDLHVYSEGDDSGQTDINLEYKFTGTPRTQDQDSDWTLRADSNLGKFHIIDSGTERLTINLQGRVGIGTSNPVAKLDVADGALLFSGTTGSTPSSGEGTRMMWIPEKASFRAGKVSGDEWDDNNIGDASTAMGNHTEASGNYSTAMGSETKASGNYSTAMGWNTTAGAKGSTAMGSETSVGGDYSTAVGYQTYADGEASTAMGHSTGADGDYSTAMGHSTVADGDASTAMGHQTNAGSYASTAMGSETTASGNTSTAMGSETTAGSFASTAMGRDTTASHSYSTAMGQSTTAAAKASTAMGRETTASGYVSTAMGRETTANGDYSTAMGRNTTASHDYSTAMGHSTIASGESSTAMGHQTNADSDYSTAMGNNTEASGEASTAMGQSTTADGEASTAMGQSTTAIGHYSTAMGYLTTASGYASTAMGHSTTASNSYSIAMGNHTEASGDASTAMGNHTTASGPYSTAMGRNIWVDGVSSFGIGLDNIIRTVTQDHTMAIMGGNVGIGTVNPAEKLDVDGSLQAEDIYATSLDLENDLIVGSDIILDGNLVYNNPEDRVVTAVFETEQEGLGTSWEVIISVEIYCDPGQLLLVNAVATLGQSDTNKKTIARTKASSGATKLSGILGSGSYSGAMVGDAATNSGYYTRSSIGWTDIYKCGGGNATIVMEARETGNNGYIYGTPHDFTTLTVTKF